MSEINTANETPEFPRDRLSNVSSTTSSPADTTPKKATLREVIATMPLRVKMASIWLFLVFFNAYTPRSIPACWAAPFPCKIQIFKQTASTPQPAHLAAVSQLQESPPLTGWEPMQLLETLSLGSCTVGGCRSSSSLSRRGAELLSAVFGFTGRLCSWTNRDDSDGFRRRHSCISCPRVAARSGLNFRGSEPFRD